MNTKLENDEQDFVRDLLAWEQRRRPLEWLLSNLALVLGGVVILVTIFYTLRHLTDRLVFWVTVPGFLLGVVFVGIYYFGGKRIKERHRVAVILKKLMA
ncbi:hypothetical protein EDS67_08195 [candidate division KSB1 bacterium]|nr:MAG: hypothetical protein EDS67_08195 [candidate division KSB1 bacterium]MBC6948033.1 hypothetical protein [candidate division KSB1 bacterium]MCE7943466.1 hypothetical protein [Chlorobi bacterium CHB1]MDL1877438.1 hypothetical protein [Cytophagia bacterium CHB2]